MQSLKIHGAYDEPWRQGQSASLFLFSGSQSLADLTSFEASNGTYDGTIQRTFLFLVGSLPGCGADVEVGEDLARWQGPTHDCFLQLQKQNKCLGQTFLVAFVFRLSCAATSNPVDCKRYSRRRLFAAQELRSLHRQRKPTLNQWKMLRHPKMLHRNVLQAPNSWCSFETSWTTSLTARASGRRRQGALRCLERTRRFGQVCQTLQWALWLLSRPTAQGQARMTHRMDRSAPRRMSSNRKLCRWPWTSKKSLIAQIRGIRHGRMASTMKQQSGNPNAIMTLQASPTMPTTRVRGGTVGGKILLRVKAWWVRLSRLRRHLQSSQKTWCTVTSLHFENLWDR